jgi:hypothetical protein
MNPRAFKKHGWLLVAALMMFFMASGSLMEYYRRLDVAQDLVSGQGHFLTGTCDLFHAASTRGYPGRLVAAPVIQYEYVFKGKRYVSNRYGRLRGMWLYSKAECDGYIENIRTNPELRLWLDPDKPEVAVLENRLNPPLMEYVFIAIGVLFVLCCVYLIFRRGKHDD